MKVRRVQIKKIRSKNRKSLKVTNIIKFIEVRNTRSENYKLRSSEPKNTGGKPQHKKLRCHHCRTRDKDKEYLICGSYPKCLCGFCHDCLRDKFELDPKTLPKDWNCVVCVKKCPCERCAERLQEEQNEIKAKDITKISKKNEETKSKTATKKVGKITSKAKQVEEEESERPSKIQKSIQSKADTKTNQEPKKAKKRKNAEEIKNTRPTNNKPTAHQQEEMMERMKDKKGKVKEQKKTMKEDNNIVKISMKQQPLPIMAMQNPYIQNTEITNQFSHQMPYLLMPQQYSLNNQRYTSLQNANNNPFAPASMPSMREEVRAEQGVLKEQQEKGRKRKKINKEQ